MHAMGKRWTLATVIMIGLGCGSMAQVLPVDSLTGRITYTGVVQVDSTTADELFSRATLWYAATFKSAKAAMELSDRATGVITSDPAANFPAYFIFNNGNRKESGRIQFSLKIQCKDGRFKYTLTDLVHIHPDGYKMLLERESQMAYRKVLWATMKEEANKSVTELIQSLTKSMSSRKAADGGDW